ncbi:ATP-binding cassette domain-containing protein, partial [Lactiplantibacillus plantarum]|uniref:ATP-binding cassette domain-containing protein n=1 Tax=Lactiplantibacillus plantarum TaxID=1590 RepID=UPI001D090D9E|nr:ATP-binding cassette domain-containing protein [Lactiplantibacillus plantarum]
MKNVNLRVERGTVNALIGPSGCGKTTFLRAINRMHDLTPGARVEGTILLDGENVYGSGVDPVTMRRRVGMVFQKPN